MIPGMEKADFEKLLGQRFEIHYGEGESLSAELTEVSGIEADSDHREPFSVLFLGPEEPILAQQIYRLESSETGRLDLFLVPLGPARDGDGCLYEAVFT